MNHITVWILFETGTTRIRLLIFNGRKQNEDPEPRNIYIAELCRWCKDLNLIRRHREIPYSSDIFSKILLVCQAFTYPRAGNAASEIDTKSAAGICFTQVNCHNSFGGYGFVSKPLSNWWQNKSSLFHHPMWHRSYYILSRWRESTFLDVHDKKIGFWG